MNINFASLGLAAAGLYLQYSGFKQASEKDSRGWGAAKVALGTALVGSQIDLVFGGPGLLSRVESLFKTYQDVEPSQTCSSLTHLESILAEGGKDSRASDLFRILNKTKGVTCKNFLPWKDSFHAGGTGYIDGIRPTELDQSVMWGIDSVERPFVAIRHTCDKVTNGAVAFFQRYRADPNIVVSGGHHLNHKCIFTSGTWNQEREQWLLDLLSKGSAKLKWLSETAHLVV